jgi:thiol-disulfide isomerase/thioredoxin
MRTFKYLSFFLAAGIMMLSCSEQPATSYTIEANLQGIPEGAKVELIPGASHKNEKPVAETVVADGKFTFTGVADEPRMFYIHIAESYGLGKIMVENGKIILTGHVEKSEQGEAAVYNFGNMTVKGSKSHDLYIQKIAPRKMLDSMYRANRENNKISAAVCAVRNTKDQARIDSLDNTDAAKKFAALEKHFFETVEKTMKGLIMDNKDSWWGPMLMLDVMTYFTPEQNAWYEEFSREAKDSYYGKIVEAELNGIKGQTLPAFTLADKDSKETTVAAVGKGKKYILVDFWASWCAPCRKEMPNLKRLYEKYSSKGFEIISISTDKKEADWKKVLEKEKFAWPNFLDTKGAADACNVSAIPAMFLLDDKGVVIAEKIHGEELAKKLEELFP